MPKSASYLVKNSPLRANTQPNQSTVINSENESSANSFLDEAIALDVYDCNGINLGRHRATLGGALDSLHEARQRIYRCGIEPQRKTRPNPNCHS
jgi:hypothetical protein